MSVPAGYFTFKLNSVDTNSMSFYFSSQGGGTYFNAALYTSTGALLISWPDLLMGNETVSFHGLVEPGQSYIIVLQDQNDSGMGSYQTNVSIPANAPPPTTPFTPGITGGKMNSLSVNASVTWNTDGTGTASLSFPVSGTMGIAQVLLNGTDITQQVSSSSGTDLLNLPSTGNVTVAVPVPNANNTIQVKTGGGASWSASFNSPGRAQTTSTQTISNGWTFFGITLPVPVWLGGAGIIGYALFRRKK